jgi:hypothetical protein
VILAVDQDCGNRSCSKSLAQKKQSKSAGSWAWHWTQWTCSASSAFCLIIWRHVKHSPALLGPVSIFDFCCGPALGATSHTCVSFQNRDAGKWSALHSGQAVRVDIPFQWCGFGFQRFTLERKPPIGGFTGPTCTAHLHAFPVVEHDQIILGWLSQQSQLVNFPGDKPSFSRLSSYPVYI